MVFSLGWLQTIQPSIGKKTTHGAWKFKGEKNFVWFAQSAIAIMHLRIIELIVRSTIHPNMTERSKNVTNMEIWLTKQVKLHKLDLLNRISIIGFLKSLKLACGLSETRIVSTMGYFRSSRTNVQLLFTRHNSVRTPRTGCHSEKYL